MIDRLMTDLERMVRGVLPELPFLGTYRYRVVRANSGDSRWHLQVVVDRGLPDILPISIWPGCPGVDSQLQLGTTVLVQFIEGRRDMPVITHFAPPGDAGWRPALLTLDASSMVSIGATASEILLGAGAGRVLREGDTLSLTGVQAGAGTTGVQATITLGLGVPPAPSRVKA